MSEQNVQTVEALACRHFNRGRNLGDALSPWLLGRLFNTPVYYPAPNVGHVLAIGSIFFLANEYSYFWGSGLLDPAKDTGTFDPRKVRALRGTATLERLRELGHVIPDVPLGDPGFLVSDVMPREWKADPGRYRAAVIPHLSSFHHSAFDPLRERDDIALIDMRTDNPEVLRTIAESEVVISESLHGLIFGIALGRPVTWISRRHNETWKFKFRDCFSICRNAPKLALPFERGLDDWIGAARRVEVMLDRMALLAAFPWDEVVRRVPSPLLGFEGCRASAPVLADAELFDAPARFHAEGIDAPELKARVLSEVSQAQRGRAYPTYTVIGPSGSVPERVLDDACKALDAAHHLSFATVIGGEGDGTGLNETKRLLGGALVIRPNRSFDPAGPFGTLEYRA